MRTTVAYTEGVSKRGLDLTRFVDITSTNAARTRRQLPWHAQAFRITLLSQNASGHPAGSRSAGSWDPPVRPECGPVHFPSARQCPGVRGCGDCACRVLRGSQFMLRLAWAVAASRPSTNGRSTMTDKLNVLVRVDIDCARIAAQGRVTTQSIQALYWS